MRDIYGSWFKSGSAQLTCVVFLALRSVHLLSAQDHGGGRALHHHLPLRLGLPPLPGLEECADVVGDSPPPSPPTLPLVRGVRRGGGGGSPAAAAALGRSGQADRRGHSGEELMACT